MQDPLRRLLDGFQDFRNNYYGRHRPLIERLAAEGQRPKVLLIGCSDSRVDPAIITHCEPGQLFVVRNVAALVPPCEADGRHHGTSAALEFGVRGLGVEHIVVLGHALCGGIRALGSRVEAADGPYQFLTDWVRVAAPARDAVHRSLGESDPETAWRAMEQAAVVASMGNLLGFPWIASRVTERALRLHGWYFDITAGELSAYDSARGLFAPVRDRPAPALPSPEAGTSEPPNPLDPASFVQRLAAEICPTCGKAHG